MSMYKFIISIFFVLTASILFPVNSSNTSVRKQPEKGEIKSFQQDYQLTINAVMTNSDGSQTSEIEGQAASAPADISFSAEEVDPATTFYIWNIYNAADPQNAIVRYTDQSIRQFIFKEAGDYIVTLETSDEYADPTGSASMRFSITDFQIEAPNYIILDGTHQFKIKYQSLFNFKCTIFNRWGNKVYEFTDPSGGWDGTHNGRLVSTGVYYYVITAQRGNGKKEVKKGYINALRRK
ncbi:MAG TPA: hypothetical protein DIT04_10675 [Dysgonomonas sp.]|nr:hypothetical protein [Dysgonomonas sp.]